MSAAGLVLLIYNIDNAMSSRDSEDADWHIVVLKQAAVRALEGQREARMTPEGVILEMKAIQVPLAVLSGWLASKRVNSQEVASHLRRFDSSALLYHASGGELDEGLLNILQSELDIRQAQLLTLGNVLMSEIETFTLNLPTKTLELVREANLLINRLKVLEERCKELNRTNSGAGKSLNSDTGLVLRRCASALSEALKNRLLVPTVVLTDVLIRDLSNALLALGTPPEQVKALEAQTPKRLVASSQPLSDDDIPPPPPDDPEA
jgi:hypothetical protein